MSSTPYRVLYASQALMVTPEEVTAPIEALNPLATAELDRLLEVWLKIDLRPADLDSDGVKYSADDHRQLVRSQMSNLLGGVGGLAAGRVVVGTVESDEAPVGFWARVDGCRPWIEGGCVCGSCS